MYWDILEYSIDTVEHVHVHCTVQSVDARQKHPWPVGRSLISRLSEGAGGGGTIDIGAIITIASTATLTEHPTTIDLVASNMFNK